MSKHTKGPWTAFTWDKNKPHEIAIGASQAEGGADHVCLAEFKGGMADARLIAAAPEMLDALLLAWGVMAQAGLDTGNAFRAVENAIAKAEGRQ